MRQTLVLLLACTILAVAGCGESSDKIRVTVWHQMVVSERAVLNERIAAFMEQNPDIEVRALYKETEELRSGFQAAALAGTGPELVFGPSDALGAFVTMEIVADMSPWFDETACEQFVDQALTRLPDPNRPGAQMLVQVGDRVGNHLALVYNRNLIERPPRTTDEMVEMAVAATLDPDGDGRIDQYGIVWNFIEPFFLIPFLTGHEGWVFDETDPTLPALDTPECAAAMNFVAQLQSKYKVLPANCDYETADALFKDGSAAMIINGDWSWGDYLANESIDAAVAPLPIVSSTGKPMGPMVATKGYSLNVHAQGAQAEAAIRFVRFMTTEASQREFMTRLKTLPSLKSLLDDPLLKNDPTLLASAEQMKNGKPMPVVAELRAVWDAMRPSYQALLAGNITAEQAAREMQRGAVQRIGIMNQKIQPGSSATVIKVVFLLAIVALIAWQWRELTGFLGDWKNNRLAYLLVAPAMLVLALTIVYPFFYNVVLSFSNMSLSNFQDWQITGVQNYVDVIQLQEPEISLNEVGLGEYLQAWLARNTFYAVLLKTIIWTVVCVFFHVAIGLLLAAMLNGPVRGKTVYRVLLILPWAIPAYITALTWRGMFNADYGAVNLIANQYFGLPVVDWLGDPTNAMIACILTNIWLGFPFMMVIALGGMQGIPHELYEAARIDQVPRWKQFWHITLPMLRPVLVPATTLGAIWTFNNLNVIWLVSNGGEPSDQTHILVSYVYKAVFNLYQYGYGAALSMVIFLLLLVFSLFFLWRTRATEAVV